MSQLEEYRDQIDAVDRELVELFRRRMDITAKVGQYKLERQMPVLDAARERRVVEARTAMVEDAALKADVAELYASIMAISRRQQRRLVHEGTEDPGYAAWVSDLSRARTPVANPRVVYQGEPGCYSEEAAVGFFGPQVNSRGLAWFTDVFAALDAGEADYAVLPVENSSTAVSYTHLTLPTT